jgi:hypothetical protein
MANFRSSSFSVINWSYFRGLSSNKSVKNTTSRSGSKIKLLLFIFLLSSCTIGGEETTQGVVTIDDSTVTTVLDEEITFEEGVLNFAKCMREEGINFPDPSFDIDGNPEFDNLEIENEDEFETAFENCEEILRNALPEQFDLDPEVEAALVDASLEFSQCMREQGIDFPDPKPGEFGFFAFRDADIDFSSESVQQAFEICQPENPLDSLDD